MFGLESIKDPEGNVIREAPLRLGELPATGDRRRHSGGQHENRFEDKARGDRAFKTSSGSRAEIHVQNQAIPKRGNSLTVDVLTRLQ